MGNTYTKVKIFGNRVEEIVALVDTASTFAKIPESVGTQLAIKPHREIEVELGDNRIIKRKLATVEIEIENEKDLVPVTFSPDEEFPLVGCTTLEILGLKVNPLTQRLEKTRYIEY